jgi:mono/diheme cytochrome c family protein
MSIGSKGLTFVIACATVALIVALKVTGGDDENMEVAAEIVLPELSQGALEGKVEFDANCASCHGENALGTDKGPPLIHVIYEPGHHGDESFQRAAANGVSQHHWPFGDMPAQPQVTREQVEEIVRYIREVQLANGIGP